MVRTLLERLTRDVVISRRLPRDYGGGRLYVATGNGGLKYLKWNVGNADPDLLEMVDELVKPGAHVWDVGANMGLFAFAAANRAGPSGSVLAVEPDADNVTLLLRSRRHLDPAKNAKVDVLPAALAQPGQRVGRLNISRRSRAANALEGHGSTQMGGTRETRAVPMFAADELIDLFNPPSVVKIDVEGAEMVVLSGAERLLSQVRPTLVMEVFGAHARDVGDLLHRHDYDVLDSRQPKASRTDLAEAPWSCLAIPRKR